ncbi:methyltransferase domain-containing protein [Phycicoccus flavus]|uniref:methyltransferase domain-containing protein n=1 Tax=Phycicoccus flavus TaxID=2502783 RepID=UPI000FEBD44F|nr:methyltransferase domain-containing protein [Phycicoccus flavus]NHA69828.1 class I SAM-dependent methyltransferase [Phycicoccus flavus]
MRPYDELVAEALRADVTGWGFGWLDGRATEERPPWGYARLLAARLAEVDSALDLDTGGGEVVGEAPVLPAHTVVTEGWPPNAERARTLLGQRGVQVLDVAPGDPLPLPDASVDLVSARHPVRPPWAEISRVLRPGGEYLAQHVGPGSMFALIEEFVEVTPEQRRGRSPERESAEAESAGLEVVEVRTARCRAEIHDVGAVVWLLRKCPWWVPGFDVERDEEVLRRLDARMRTGTPVVAHSTRHLLRARRPA